MGNEKSLKYAFKDAVGRFNNMARQYEAADKAQKSLMKDSLMDAANEVFLARDDYAASAQKSGAEWSAVVYDVQDVREFLDKNDIHMYGQARTTATGARTYRILTPSRFDA